MSILDMWFRMTVPGYASEVRRENLGHLGANPWADPFRPPAPNPVLDKPYIDDNTKERQ